MKNELYNLEENDVTHGRGYVYDLKYHVVWCTKYRKNILVGGIESDIKEYIKMLADKMEIQILAMEVMPDHIHLLLSCKPQLSLADMMKIFKGTSAFWLFRNRPDLREKLWGGHLWNPTYFVATVSDRSEQQVNDYIANQKTAPPKPRKKRK